jgi:hypothetical protein
VFWAKKVRGKLVYFGKVADDPQRESALDRWLGLPTLSANRHRSLQAIDLWLAHPHSSF